jgi:hypothetical protein
LAHDPIRISALEAKVKRHRGRYPLFDTKRFALNIKASYKTARERYRQGKHEPVYRISNAL